jgi:hypothetical protein
VTVLFIKGDGVNTLLPDENLPVAGIKMELGIVGFQKADYTCSIFSKMPARAG